ncbi:MEG10-like protein [Mya arenaria]|uniref:MEG10-like protein n=1 Tax=Mya arenaria TaxID=6604 RepID=A0ABY7DLT3_MYAAR|nr:MEG10-like protein [Mya arenaria]
MTLHATVVPDSTLCLACSATVGIESPWLQIDFGTKAMMRTLRIFGRDYDTPGQSSNLLVSISNTSHFVNQNFSTWEDFGLINASDPYNGVMWDLGVNRVLQYLVFRRPLPSVMAICEVAVFNTDCEKGFFGDKCASMCQCKDEQPCDSVTGKCATPGCFAGWKGDSCSTDSELSRYTTNANHHILDKTVAKHVIATYLDRATPSMDFVRMECVRRAGWVIAVIKNVTMVDLGKAAVIHAIATTAHRAITQMAYVPITYVKRDGRETVVVKNVPMVHLGKAAVIYAIATTAHRAITQMAYVPITYVKRDGRETAVVKVVLLPC